MDCFTQMAPTRANGMFGQGGLGSRKAWGSKSENGDQGARCGKRQSREPCRFFIGLGFYTKDRTSHIICGTQCKMKCQVPWFKNYSKGQDDAQCIKPSTRPSTTAWLHTLKLTLIKAIKGPWWALNRDTLISLKEALQERSLPMHCRPLLAGGLWKPLGRKLHQPW